MSAMEKTENETKIVEALEKIKNNIDVLASLDGVEIVSESIPVEGLITKTKIPGRVAKKRKEAELDQMYLKVRAGEAIKVKEDEVDKIAEDIAKRYLEDLITSIFT
jgi:hypothetical protein